MIGTRPEAIKLAPVVRVLKSRPQSFAPVVIGASQHHELLAQALRVLALPLDINLALMTPEQQLSDFAGRCLAAVGDTLLSLRPDAVIVQGDTSTALAAALAATYHGAMLAHVEAGLRTNDRGQPFPEELHRRLIAVLAHIHLAPTPTARLNLLREGIAASAIVLTGNTIVDALHDIAAAGHLDTALESPQLRPLALDANRFVLLTVHRRENHGARLLAICDAARRIVASRADVSIVVPLHPNPRVRSVLEAELGGRAGIHLCAPLDYPDLLRLLSRAEAVLTDSGGIQEESSSFGTPVVLLRENTERPELIHSGTGILAGTDAVRIADVTNSLLSQVRDTRRRVVIPSAFGDGRAAQRIADALDVRLQAWVARCAAPGAPPP